MARSPATVLPSGCCSAAPAGPRGAQEVRVALSTTATALCAILVVAALS